MTAAENPKRLKAKKSIVITAETPFYGESGGQVGDRGTIRTARGDMMEIIDTQHPTPQLTAHRGRVKKGRIQIGDTVQLAVDGKFRRKTACSTIQRRISSMPFCAENSAHHVRQAGSLVTPERLRFDFNHTGAIPDEKLAAIEAHVNRACSRGCGRFDPRVELRRRHSPRSSGIFRR